MKITSYEDWQNLPAREGLMIDCVECNGCGQKMCESCGNDSDCDACDQTGSVLESGLSKESLANHRTFLAWRGAVFEDFKPLAHHRDCSYINTLVEAGFNPYSSIYSKHLVLGH